MKNNRTIELVNPRGRIIFRYKDGDESLIFDAIIEQVHAGVIDWFDASLISQKIGQHVAEQLKPLIPIISKDDLA